MNNFAAVPGSPLFARQDVGRIYGLIILLLLIIGLLLALAFILRILHQHTTPEWMAAQKNKATRIANINNVANKYRLTKDEKNLLWNMCHRNDAPNIEYLIHDENAINDLFRREYLILSNQKNPDQILSTFFALRFKLERAHALASIITSSKNIPEGISAVYTDNNDRRYTFQILRNTKEGIYLQLSNSFNSLADKPQELVKLDLVLTLATGIQYNMNTRLVRYQTGLDGLPEMLVTHTNALTPFNKRQSRRLLLNQKCLFAAVRITAQEKGLPQTITYEPFDHRYEGILVDISCGGCQLATKLPIKIDQYIWIELKMDSLYTDEAVGLIVNTKRNMEDDLYTLHIKFIKISPAAQNRISARVYNYTA